MKSVFFLSLMNGASWGGSEEIWYQTALWMARNKHKVAVGVFDWEDKRKRLLPLSENGCEIFWLPGKKQSRGIWGKFRLKKAVAAIPFESYDLTVINQGGWEEVVHGPFSNLHQRLERFVLLYHNYDYSNILSFKKQQLLRQWIDAAAMNIALSGKVFDMLDKNYGIRPARKMVYVNPVSFEPVTEPGAYPATGSGYQWIMMAELDTRRKAQHLLLQALAAEKWKGRNWTLSLYGKGKDEELLKKLITELGLEDKVMLKGFTGDVKTALENAHLLLQCTLIDAMPLSVMEAMACARPCVVSGVGDMPDWIRHRESGFICDAVTADNIEATLEQAWQQRENWQIMGLAARRVFLEKYPRPYASRFYELLNSL